MPLSVVMDTVDDLPEPVKELYSERDGKWVLTGVEGVKTQADVDRVTRALEAEKGRSKGFQDKLAAWGELTPESVHEKLDRIGELELAAADKIEGQDKKMEDMVERRLNTRMAPVQREANEAKAKLAEAMEQMGKMQKREQTRTIQDAIVAAMDKHKVHPESRLDILPLGLQVMGVDEEGKVVSVANPFGIPEGLDADMMIDSQRGKRRWWPESQGGGAKGSSGSGGFTNNPWTDQHWSMTEQSKVVKTDRDKAERMAAAAGTKIGGPRPVAKR